MFFNLIISTTICSFTYLLLKKNKFISEKFNNLKRLYNLVSTRHSSPIIITLISIKMILQSFYLEFHQIINNTVIKIDKNKYILTYILNGKEYKMIISPSRGPSPVFNIVNDKNANVTDEIIPYLGPNNDWNNYKFSPDFFRYKTLTFHLLNGQIIDFHDKDIIAI